jgi:hypothetical protein
MLMTNNLDNTAEQITDLLTEYGFISEYPIDHDSLKKDIVAIIRKNNVAPVRATQKELKPDKNVKAPEYTYLTEGYDPDKLPKRFRK